jgi:septal ring factor EnvC (AmiA/AmiB activator)
MKTSTLLIAILAGMVLAGCDEIGYQPNRKRYRSAKLPDREATHLADETVTGDGETGGRTAVESAMKWADKYAEAAKELIVVNRRIGEMEKEKKALQAQLAQLQKENATLKRELGDANAMLVDMKKDLKEWRRNVLGFREEIITSQSAQLKAMQRILELLGGEVTQPIAQPRPAPDGSASNANVTFNALNP